MPQGGVDSSRMGVGEASDMPATEGFQGPHGEELALPGAGGEGPERQCLLTHSQSPGPSGVKSVLVFPTD